MGCIARLCNIAVMTQTLGADLLHVVARINRLATQRARLPCPSRRRGCCRRSKTGADPDIGSRGAGSLLAADDDDPGAQARRRGYVSRTVDPDDARAVLVQITSKGVETLRQVRVDREAAIEPYLERLDASDRQALSEAVRVLRGLLADAASPPPPNDSDFGALAVAERS